MSLQKAGRDHDNHVANALHENTTDDVRVVSMRGSGNTSYPAADVMAIHGDTIHDIELKKKSLAVGDKGYIDGLDELAELPEPRWFGVTITNRETVVVSANGDDPLERIVGRLPACFEAYITDGGRLCVTKPTAGQWNSKQSGEEDWRVVADALDLPVEEDDE